jgi:vacuolar-type H+-ATPase subunit H
MKDFFNRIVEIDAEARQIVDSAQNRGDAAIQAAKEKADANIVTAREKAALQEKELLAAFREDEAKMREENDRVVEDLLASAKVVVDNNWDRTIEAGLDIFEKLK